MLQHDILDILWLIYIYISCNAATILHPKLTERWHWTSLYLLWKSPGPQVLSSEKENKLCFNTHDDIYL